MAPKFFSDGRYVVRGATPPMSGEMGTVYHCVDLESEGEPREVAVKVIKGPDGRDDLARDIYDSELNLKDLAHANIVELIDFGQIEVSGEYFIVMEWVPNTLSWWLDRHQPVGPDDFIESIGIPILEALAFAHEKQVTHRDIKPANILVSQDGSPKLADFGISRLKRLPDAGDQPTKFRHFGSEPYCPPAAESDYFRWDVFSVGAVFLTALSDVPLRGYDDFDVAIDHLDCPPKLKTLIERATTLHEARDRPANGIAMLAELSSIQRSRRKKWGDRKKLTLRVSEGARKKIAREAEISDFAVNDLLAHELQEPPALRVAATDSDAERPLSRHFFAYGQSWSFRVALDPNEPHVQVLGGKRVGEPECDQRRDQHFVAEEVEFTASPALSQVAAAGTIQKLLDDIDAYEDEAAQERVAREEQRLFDQWRRQLDAREAVEASQEKRATFSTREVDGRRLTLQKLVGAEFHAEEKVSIYNNRGMRLCRGEVESIAGDTLTLYLDRAPSEPLPRDGAVAIDSRAAREKLKRERSALNAVRYRNADLRRSDLPRLVLAPAEARIPRPVGASPEWVRSDLDDSKRAAVGAALNSDDFFVVHGPPGTGKTTFIAELVAQLLRKGTQRILLSSQGNVALDNALQRIRDTEPDLPMLRLGSLSSGKIGQSVLDLALEHQLDRWRLDVRKRSEKYLEKMGRENSVNLPDLRLSLMLTELAESMNARSEIAARMRHLADVADGRDMAASGWNQRSPEELAAAEEELDQLAGERANLDRDISLLRAQKPVSRRLGSRKAVSAEWLLEQARDLLSNVPAEAELKRLIELQARWLERLGRGPEFQAAILMVSRVVAGTCVGLARARGINEVPFDVCIVDEASRATATETLIPLVRANRWILVGDEFQLPPFQDNALRSRAIAQEFGLDTAELETTLFSRMAHGLPPDSSAFLGKQYRMIPAIGGMISECFYDGKLASANSISPFDLSLIQERPVVWFSTEHMDDRRERRVGGGRPASEKARADRTSDQDAGFTNAREAREIVNYVSRLDFLLAQQTQGEKVGVLVLSPYRRQVEELSRRLAQLDLKCPGLTLEVNTVDAVQGRESEVLIYSCVRSNPESRPGFTVDVPRANVALSRGRFALAIFGDASFYASVTSPFAEVLRYIRTHPTDCALTTIEA